MAGQKVREEKFGKDKVVLEPKDLFGIVSGEYSGKSQAPHSPSIKTGRCEKNWESGEKDVEKKGIKFEEKRVAGDKTEQ